MRLRGALLLLLPVLAVAPGADAARFVVDAADDAVDASPGDGACATAAGTCTVRAAIMEANASPERDEVALGPGTHVLSLSGADEDACATGDLDVTAPLDLAGAGRQATILAAGAGFGDRVVHVLAAGQVTVSDLTISGGRSALPTLDGDAGGLLAVGTTIEVHACGFRDNASADYWGGGLHVVSGSSVVEDSTFENNSGGGAALTGTEAVVSRCVFRGNTESGGLSLFADYALLLDTWIDANESEGNAGGLHASVVHAERCAITRNLGRGWGGGVTIGGTNRPSVICNSTIAGNVARADAFNGIGGGIAMLDGVSLELWSVTVTGNHADTYAGAFNGRYFVRMGNSVVTGNDAPMAPDIGEVVTSAGHNFVSHPEDVAWWPADSSDILSGDALLGPLLDNGGSLPSCLPLEGSPLIDAASPSGCFDEGGNPLGTDSRGLPRARDGDADGVDRCDIGAAEVQVPYGPDDDGDGRPNAVDCAPSDAGSFALPGEAMMLVIKAPGTDDARLGWTDESAAAGASTRYDVASDRLSVLLRAARVANGPCVQSGLATTQWTDSRAAAGDGWYYLVRAVNACGPPALQGWGADSRGNARPACP